MKERSQSAGNFGVAACFVLATGAAGPAIAQDAAESSGAGLAERLSAGITIGEEYNDNIFSTRAAREADWITTIAPWLGLELGDNDARVNLGANAEYGAYASNSDENYLDYRFYANGRVRFAPGFLLLTNLSHSHDHEDRGSPDDVNGSEPTEYDLTRGVAAILKRFGQTIVKLGTTYDRYDFEDSGIINNDDRDRQIVTAGMRAERRAGEAARLFGEVYFNNREYRTSVDDNGFNRDSDGIRAAAGVNYRFSPTLDGEIYAGWIYQDYADGALADVSTPDIGGRLNWRPADGTSLIFNAERSVEETTLSGASSYVLTGLSLDWLHWISEDVRLHAGANYAVHDYQGVNRTDHVYGVDLGIRRYLNPHTYVNAGYAFRGRQSDDIIQNYDQSRFMVRLGADLQPAYDAATTGTNNGAGPDDAGSMEPGSRSTFYLGAQTGVLTSGTWLDGPRGAGGSLQADFADYGMAGELFAGYGYEVADWYFGLEGDISIADVEWDHSRLPGGRVFSVRRNWALGVSGMVGRRLMGGSLVYGRAGLKLAEFDTDYQTPSGSRFDDTLQQIGLGFGLGAEAPVSSNVSLRMEYDYTAFDDYDMVIPSGTDIFANNESGVWLGVSYSLQGRAPDPADSKAAEFSGFYAGVQAGHGSLLSNDTTGPRNAGSVLVADFGDTGFTGGVFAGYNAQFERWVFGGEVDAEISDAAWDHEREPTGRSFSLEKQYSLGASLRAGYVLGQAALVYARAGIVHSGLEYNFLRGMTALSADLGETGLRFGMGMEMPMTEQLNVRLDFTHTDYGRQSVFIPGVGNGEERFDVSETLFRLGTAYRF
jgi:opacity protein-like surface antigen